MVITPVKIDDLTYGYNLDGNGNLVNNKLNHIDDPVSSLLCSYDIDDQSQDNYLYDAIGNLTKDNAEGIDNIEWNAYGKISKITRATGVQKSNLEFMYDAMGNRVCKIEKPYNLTSTGWKYTFYVRDASGNIMTTYTKTGSEIENNVLLVDEIMLYGSSRIGTKKIGKELTGIVLPTAKFSRTLGLKRYEVSNHLGNVLATFTDRKYQIQSSNQVTGYKTYIASSQDYYPFGMIMNERKWNTSGYRFGFNGKEMDNEVSGDGNQYDYGFRIYNPRIGRFLSVDPLTRNYPMLTSYQYASNRPIDGIDIDGLEYIRFDENKPINFTGLSDTQIEKILKENYKYHQGNIDIKDVKNVVENRETWTVRDRHNVFMNSTGTEIEQYQSFQDYKNEKPYKTRVKRDISQTLYHLNDMLEGSSDGANTGRMTTKDVVVGLGVIGTITGVGAMIEAGTITVAGVIGVVNCLDDAMGGLTEGNGSLSTNLAKGDMKKVINYTKIITSFLTCNKTSLDLVKQGAAFDKALNSLSAISDYASASSGVITTDSKPKEKTKTP